MHARVITTKIKSGEMDNFIDQYEQGISSASDEARQNHRSTYLLVDRDTNQAMVVAFWDSLDDADAAAKSQWNQELTQRMQPFFESAPSRASYEVGIVQHSQS